MTRLVQLLNAHPTSWVLLILAGAAFHIITEAWWKGLLLLAGALCLDLGVDGILTKLEKKAGEI